MAHALATSSRQYSRWKNGLAPLPDGIEGRLKNLRLGDPKAVVTKGKTTQTIYIPLGKTCP